MGCYFFLQGIFPIWGSNPGLPHCRQTLYHLSYQGSHHFIIHLQTFTTYLLCTRHWIQGWGYQEEQEAILSSTMLDAID